MKKIYIIPLVIIILMFWPYNAYADEVNKEDYQETLQQFDFDFFEEKLDDDTYELLEELDLTGFDFESIESLDFIDAINIVINIITGKISGPLKYGLTVLVFIIITSLLQSMKSCDESISNTYSVVSSIIISVLLIVQISPTITLASSTIAIVADFIYAFLPVFCGIVIASGGVTTTFSTNSNLIMLSQVLSFISSNVFMPIINCFLSLGICSSLSPEIQLEKLVIGLKKFITSTISFISAMFVSLVSIKTSVSAKADILGIRSVRLVINTVVPVIGSSISEGLLSIQGYSSLIKSSVGIVGIIAVILVFLPSVLEIVLWRVILSICSVISEVFNEKCVTKVLNAFKDTLLLMNVLLVLSMLTTVISIGVLVSVKTS